LTGVDADGDNTFALPTPAQDDFSETLTASFAIWDNLLTRVEYRYDHIASGVTGSGDDSSFPSENNVLTYQDQNEISLEAVYSF
jgi:hypothetical protein